MAKFRTGEAGVVSMSQKKIGRKGVRVLQPAVIDAESRGVLEKNVKKMMRNDVTGKTHNQYRPVQVDFILFCYENYKAQVVNELFFEAVGATEDGGKVSQGYLKERLQAQLDGDEGVLCPLRLDQVTAEIVGQ